MKMNTAAEARRCDEFRLLLQKELVDRCGKNPRYSLRAFARSLEIGPSALSDMLNGKRAITEKMKARLSKNLGAAPLPSTGHDFSQITLDSFALISDWYHYAILELMKTKGFQPDTGWISRALGISVAEAKAAVERLERMDLIQREGKKWKDTSGGFSTNISGQLTSAGSKKLQRQILEQALRALDEVPIERRNHTSMTMAIHPDDLPIAIEKIRKFRRDLSRLLESRKEVTEVYQLAVSFFPSTKISKGAQQ